MKKLTRKARKARASLGGEARAEKLTAARRKAIAKKASAERWRRAVPKRIAKLQAQVQALREQAKGRKS